MEYSNENKQSVVTETVLLTNEKSFANSTIENPISGTPILLQTQAQVYFQIED
jgi:hypothetical protein